jgi:hypothetical protein
MIICDQTHITPASSQRLKDEGLIELQKKYSVLKINKPLVLFFVSLKENRVEFNMVAWQSFLIMA